MGLNAPIVLTGTKKTDGYVAVEGVGNYFGTKKLPLKFKNKEIYVNRMSKPSDQN